MFLLSATALAVPSPDGSAPGLNDLEARKGCSGQRQFTDKCQGTLIGQMDSFKDWSDTFTPTYLSSTNFVYSKDKGGKCCSKKEKGNGGLDLGRGQGREDCGYCYSERCKA